MVVECLGLTLIVTYNYLGGGTTHTHPKMELGIQALMTVGSDKGLIPIHTNISFGWKELFTSSILGISTFDEQV